jgi:hypothetical protein
MEAVFSEGLQSVHLHPGAEAWYVLSGAQWLETSDSTIIARAGEGSVVQQGPPMRLSSVDGDSADSGSSKRKMPWRRRR